MYGAYSFGSFGSTFSLFLPFPCLNSVRPSFFPFFKARAVYHNNYYCEKSLYWCVCKFNMPTFSLYMQGFQEDFMAELTFYYLCFISSLELSILMCLFLKRMHRVGDSAIRALW